MTCEHCVAAVTARLRELDGVGDVAVELVPDGASTVTVSSAQPLDGRVVRSAVAAAGYRMAR
ncbi:MAG: heavy-metal-associated domain-containing protein [Mycobacteriaceae bacterium]|nr:heavy-metal-associated domain-containing protein [Mycobacteriaceae bacterium]